MNLLIKRHQSELRLLNKLSVSEAAKLSKLSKSYISQVKSGKRPPSEKLLEALNAQQKPTTNYFNLFLQSREAMGVSPKTIRFYKERLSKFICQTDYLKAERRHLEAYLGSIKGNQNGFSTRHASYRAIKAFYNWLNIEFGITNPTVNLQAPILGKPILPTLDKEQVMLLIEKSLETRDKAIIALFSESGLRLSELTHIMPKDIDWESGTIKVMGKGRKEALAPFGDLSKDFLRQWLTEYEPETTIWGINEWGIVSMLRRLEKQTNLPCNPHTFRRTFACLLRKAGVDTMTIKDLGRWESLEMVVRYTRSVKFEDSLKVYEGAMKG